MLSVGDSSQPDSSTIVKDGPGSYPASESGKQDYSILIYGPPAMAEEVRGILEKRRIGARLDTSDEELKVKDLLAARNYDLFLYHASKRESAQGIKSEPMPPGLEAVLLGYGVGCRYPEETIRKCRDEFEVKLLERLKK
ncbi:MAG TPA: hypothetical protein VJA23_03670 [Candidatus Nanoarchaeia archaeon]|nr:hypothetical protein [Candidatus Nanoarchaeia archaeon]